MLTLKDLKTGDKFKLPDENKVHKVVGGSRFGRFLLTDCKDETSLRTWRKEDLGATIELVERAVADSPTHGGSKEGWTRELSE